MGQKVNPIIFRLGINKKWKTEFFEKKDCELPSYFFNTLEIEDYVSQFFENQLLILHTYKSYQTNAVFTIYVSYFITNEHNKKVLVNNKNFNNQENSIAAIKKCTVLNSYNLKNYLVDFVKMPKKQTKSKIQQHQTLKKFFKVLTMFTKNKYCIIVNFCCINKNLNFLKKFQKKPFLKLQKFKRTKFLKNGIELLFYSTHSNNSANLLAKFIAVQIKKEKRHNFFISFLKQILLILVDSKFSKTKGIKILIKGKLNGMPRAKSKSFTIGNVPIQKINASIDYCQLTTHNSNGSYGIKVVVVEKSIL